MKIRKMNGAVVWSATPASTPGCLFMQAADWVELNPVGGLTQGHEPCKFLLDPRAGTVEVLGGIHEDSHPEYYGVKIAYRKKVLRYLERKGFTEVRPPTWADFIVAATAR